MKHWCRTKIQMLRACDWDHLLSNSSVISLFNMTAHIQPGIKAPGNIYFWFSHHRHSTDISNWEDFTEEEIASGSRFHFSCHEAHEPVRVVSHQRSVTSSPGWISWWVTVPHIRWERRSLTAWCWWCTGCWLAAESHVLPQRDVLCKCRMLVCVLWGASSVSSVRLKVRIQIKHQQMVLGR